MRSMWHPEACATSLPLITSGEGEAVLIVRLRHMVRLAEGSLFMQFRILRHCRRIWWNSAGTMHIIVGAPWSCLATSWVLAIGWGFMGLGALHTPERRSRSHADCSQCHIPPVECFHRGAFVVDDHGVTCFTISSVISYCAVLTQSQSLPPSRVRPALHT